MVAGHLPKVTPIMSRPIQDRLGPDRRRTPCADGSQSITGVRCPEEGQMDEISQDPKLSFGFPRRRWPDVAVAAALIAAAALTVMTSQRSQPAAPAAGRPGPAAAPA